MESVDRTYAISIKFADSCATGDVTALLIQVQSYANQAPILLTALTNQVILDYRLSFYDIRQNFQEPNGQAMSFLATLDDGSALPTWMVFNNLTQIFQFTPQCLDTTLTVKVVASDPEGLSAVGSFSVSVVNQLPSLSNPIAARKLYSGQALDFYISIHHVFHDQESDSIIVVNISQAAWISYNQSLTYFNGSTSDTDVYPVQIMYYDSCHAPSTGQYLTFTVEVADNSAPYCKDEAWSLLVSQVAHIGSVFSINLGKNSFVDDDNDYVQVIVYVVDPNDANNKTNLNNLGIWLKFDTSQFIIYGIPATDEVDKQLILSLEYTDLQPGHPINSTQFTITVSNTVPVLDSAALALLAHMPVHTGAWFEKQIPLTVCTDADNDALLIQVELYNALAAAYENIQNYLIWLTFDQTKLKLFGKPLKQETIKLRITCTDKYSEQLNSSDLTIEVFNTPPTHTLSAVQQATYHPGFNLTYTIPIASFSDQDNDTIIFTVLHQYAASSLYRTMEEDYPWLFYRPEIYTIYGIPPNLDEPIITLTVNYTDTFSDAQSFEVILRLVNTPPICTRPAALAVVAPLSLNQLFFYQIESSWFFDLDSDTVRFQVKELKPDGQVRELYEALPWLSFNQLTSAISGVAANQQYLGENCLVVIFNDGYSDDQNITVNFTLTNQEPVTVAGFPAVVSNATKTNIFYRLDDKFFDPDNDTIVFEVYALNDAMTEVNVSSLHPWLRVTAIAGRFYLQGVPDEVQTVRLAIWYTDTFSAKKCVRMDLEIFNVRPVCNFAIPAQNFHYQNFFFIQIDMTACSDAEADRILTQMKVIVGDQLYDLENYLGWLRFDPFLYKVYGSTKDGQYLKNYSLSILYYDVYSQSQPQTYNFSLNYINERPFFKGYAIQNQTHHVNRDYNFYLQNEYFEDPDSDEISYAVYAYSNSTGQAFDLNFYTKWLSFDAKSRLLHGKPTQVDHVRNYTLMVVFTDSFATETVFLNLEITNTFPYCTKTETYFEVLQHQTLLDFSYYINTSFFKDSDADYLYFDVYNYENQIQSPLSSIKWLNYNSDVKRLYGNPPAVATYTLLLYYFDGYEPFDKRQYVKILLTIFNRAPSYLGQPIVISCYVNNMCSYKIKENEFSDPENDPLYFDIKVKQISGMAPYIQVFPWLSFSQNKKQLFGQPIFADVGNYTLLIEYTDGSNYCYESVLFQIKNNKPQQIKAFAEQRVHTGTIYSYQIGMDHFTDADNNTIMIKTVLQKENDQQFNDLQARLPWLTFSKTGNYLHGIPGKSDVGQFLLDIRFTDQIDDPVDQCGSAELKMVVYNNAPKLVKPLQNYKTVLNQYTYIQIPQATFSDIDNDPLTYTIFEVITSTNSFNETVVQKVTPPMQWFAFDEKNLMITLLVPLDYKITYDNTTQSYQESHNFSITADDTFGGTAETFFLVTINYKEFTINRENDLQYQLDQTVLLAPPKIGFMFNFVFAKDSFLSEIALAYTAEVRQQKRTNMQDVRKPPRGPPPPAPLH